MPSMRSVMARDQVHVPVVARGLQQMFDAVPGGFFFAAREQHVDAVKIRFDRPGIELQAPDRRRAAPPATCIWPPRPWRAYCRCVMPRPDQPEHTAASRATTLSNICARRVEIIAAAGARHERRQQGARLQILFRELLRQRRAASRLVRCCCSSPKPCNVAKTSLQISVWTAIRSKEAR